MEVSVSFFDSFVAFLPLRSLGSSVLEVLEYFLRGWLILILLLFVVFMFIVCATLSAIFVGGAIFAFFCLFACTLPAFWFVLRCAAPYETEFRSDELGESGEPEKYAPSMPDDRNEMDHC